VRRCSRGQGSFRYQKAFGFRSVEPNSTPIDLNSTFWIASCTKLFTSIAALQCVERGLVSLDEDVSRILPEWKSPDILQGFDDKTGAPILKKATKKITLRFSPSRAPLRREVMLME
jgi:CubicO group peptidase (beta-lactamase class C family)